jgi:hypothetical protein
MIRRGEIATKRIGARKMVIVSSLEAFCRTGNDEVSVVGDPDPEAA